MKLTYQSPRAVDGGWSRAAGGRFRACRTLCVHLAVYMWPLVAPNGPELSRLASPGLVSHEMGDRGLARSAPASCSAAPGVGRLLREGVSSNKLDPLTHESLQRHFAGLHLIQISQSDHCSVLCEPRKQSPRVFDNHFCTLAVLGS